MPDLRDYIRAGYTPIMGCRKDTALEYVSRQLGYSAHYEGERIVLKIDDMRLPTNYYWENDNLFVKG